MPVNQDQTGKGSVSVAPGSVRRETKDEPKPKETLMPTPTRGKKIMTAVVTGQHPFHVPAFHQLFRSMPEIDAYIQHLEDFVSDAGNVRNEYEVVVFYNFHQTTPGNEQGWWERATKEALDKLGETPQGIFVLHHGLLAFAQWPLWAEIVGIPDRKFQFDMSQHLRVEIADPAHPITHGLAAWEMVDETYLMNDAGPGSHVLLTTNHPRSLKTLAWTRQSRAARVFCLQSGHDERAYENPSFRRIVSRGIQWLAGRI